MNCGKIAKNLSLADCGAANAGIAPELILMNFDDIDRSNCEVSGNVIAALVLSTGAKAVKYESAKNSFEASVAINKGTYLNTFTHQVLGRVFVRLQEAKDELNKLAQGKVVAIVKNLSSEDATKYEVYGFEAGLVMSDLQAASTDADGVLYTFTLASDDNAREPQLPLSLYKTSLEATETLIKGLLAE